MSPSSMDLQDGGVPPIHPRTPMYRLILVACLTVCVTAARAQHTHDHDHHGQPGLHFVHPLVAESNSPDTKVRISYEYLDPAAEHELEFEGEYAFSRAFSIEVGVHFNATETALGDTHVRLKGASYVFEQHEVLLGFGLALDLPTASGHGDEHEEMHADEHAEDEHEEMHAANGHGGFQAGPFVNAGIQTGRAEIVGWASLNIPLEGEETDTLGTDLPAGSRSSSLGYNLSTVYHAAPNLEVILELDGQLPLASGEEHSLVANLTPGVKIQPFANPAIEIGTGVSIPLTSARGFDLRFLATAFYHF